MSEQRIPKAKLFFQVARFASQVHMLRKAARFSVPARLAYLFLCRRVHAVLISICVLVASSCVVIGVAAVSPGFARILHLHFLVARGGTALL